jgi:hypothetical protein
MKLFHGHLRGAGSFWPEILYAARGRRGSRRTAYPCEGFCIVGRSSSAVVIFLFSFSFLFFFLFIFVSSLFYFSFLFFLQI